ncbi:DUF1266 domain-containing protein [Halotalea alkalilenta]|uniref:DUF1266 domain-containing protein n=1 Tax=Halotalea alkalilenta TaxID=376489 RepID=UPI000A42FEA4
MRLDEALKAWWRRNLVMSGWRGSAPERSLSRERARTRLARLDILDRSEFAWRMLELGQQLRDAPRHLAEGLRQDGLEWVALGACAGWLDEARVEVWLRVLREEAIPTDHLWGGGELSVWRVRAAFAPVLAGPLELAIDWPDALRFLTEVWDIRDREALISTLLWLSAQGQRYGWDIDARRLSELDEEGRRAWWAKIGGEAAGRGGEDREAIEAERRYASLVVEFVQRNEPLEWAAWDWLRLVDLAFAGRLLGWLGEEEATLFAAHAVDLIQRRYADWAGLAEAYQRGRSLFEGRDLMKRWHDEWRLLLDAAESPWQWPLDELLDDTLRDRSRELLRKLRSTNDSWLLALASLREPDLLHRQLDSDALDHERREEARQYLLDTLDWSEEEGAEGLSRFWLPAQSHHLNQLAADAQRGVLPSARTPFGDADPVALKVRDGLGRCAPFAATIHMAEKFAFHLLMARDAGSCDGEALDQLVGALRNTLCRFYTSPARLLEAWAVWEAALPEQEEESLVFEVRWHLEDPGSLFFWLDWHSVDWREPGPRPSLSQFCSLALTGPLSAPIWSPPTTLHGRLAEEVLDWLDSHYALHGRDGLIGFLDFLLEAGDRQEYQINYAPYTLNTRRLVEEIEILESGVRSEDEQVHLERLKRVRDNEARCNERDMTAWDVAQLVDLCVAGRQLGWLDDALLDHYLHKASALAQEHYAGWRDYAEGLYAGYAFFMTGVPEREDYLREFRQALVGWLTGAPPLAGPWASLDFPGRGGGRWPPMHIDTLPGDVHTLH